MTATREETPLVGRGLELAEIGRLLRDVATGKGCLVLVGGEAGVGKSRFAREAGIEAAARGIRSLVGRCYETERSIPFAPLVDLLGRATRSEEADSLRRALGEEASEVARIVPQLRKSFADVPPPVDLPPEQERRYLFESIATVLERTAASSPLLLALDDMHLADEATLDLLDHLGPKLASMAVLVLATYRNSELRVDHPFSEAKQARMAGRAVVRMTLKRLSVEEVSAMLSSLGGGSPPVSVLAVINGETEGNPFFVEEVVKHLKDEGRLFDTGGAWRPDIRIGELEVPGSVRAAIASRLGRLSDATRAVLAVAAIAGRSLDVVLLRELDPDTDPRIALAEAERAGIVSVAEDGTIAFSHELVRQTLEGSLPEDTRRALHARIGETLERLNSDRLDDVVAELAHHFRAAGSHADPAKTATYLMLAGERAIAASAYLDAVDHFEAAGHMLPAADERLRARALHGLGLALQGAGRWNEALPAWDQALALAEQLSDADLAGRLCSAVVLQLGWAGRWTELVRFVARGLNAVGPRSIHRALLLAIQGAIVSGSGDHQTGAGMTDTAIALAEDLGQERILGQCLLAKSGSLLISMRVARSLEVAERAAPLLRSTGALYDLAGLLGPALIAANLSGRLDIAAQFEQELAPLAERLGHPGAMFGLHTQRGFRAIAEGPDLEAFEAAARAGDEFCRRAGLVMSLHVGPTQLGCLEFWRGRWAEAAGLFRRSLELEPPGALAGSSLGPLLLAHAYAGEKSETLELLRVSRGFLPVEGRVNGIGAWTTLLGAVEALAVLGEFNEAASMYPLVIEAIEGGALLRQWDLRSLHTLAGIAARSGERFTDAARHFEKAIADAERIPLRLEEADARRFYAEALLARGADGDRSRAEGLLAEAAETYDRAGMPGHLDIVRSLGA